MKYTKILADQKIVATFIAQTNTVFLMVFKLYMQANTDSTQASYP